MSGILELFLIHALISRERVTASCLSSPFAIAYSLLIILVEADKQHAFGLIRLSFFSYHVQEVGCVKVAACKSSWLDQQNEAHDCETGIACIVWFKALVP